MFWFFCQNIIKLAVHIYMTHIFKKWLVFVCLGKAGKATSLWLIDFAIYSGFLFGVHVLANRILHVMNSILSLNLLSVKCENVAVEHFISHLLNFVFYNMCTMYMEVFGKFNTCLFRFHIPLFSEMFWNFRGFFFLSPI